MKVKLNKIISKLIDFYKAYDSIHCESLIKTLEEFGVDDESLALISKADTYSKIMTD